MPIDNQFVDALQLCRGAFGDLKIITIKSTEIQYEIKCLTIVRFKFHELIVVPTKKITLLIICYHSSYCAYDYKAQVEGGENLKLSTIISSQWINRG